MMGLLAHQSEAVKHLHEWKVGALFMEAGTGKTRVAVELVNSVPDIDLVVWFAPLRTIRPLQKGTPNVEDEIMKWGGFNAPAIYVGVESIQGSDRIYLETLAMIKSAKNPFIVVDESLKIKNVKAKRTKRLLEIGKHAQYKLILNGTPMSRNLLDLYPQMQFLSPKILNMSETEFKNTFCDYTRITKCCDYRKIVKEFITGYENIDYLYSLIRHYVYECDLKMNISQNYHSIHYHVGDDEREEYTEIKERYLSDEMLEFRNNNIFIEMTQEMQHAYSTTADKFVVLDRLFEEIDAKKTVIFCKYIDSRVACEARYPDSMVLSYQREAFGLNLQSYCNTVYFDKVWDYALRIQSSHRTYRTGQEENCHYYDLTGDVGLEKMIDKNIDKKISMTEYFKSVSREQLKKEL